MRLTRITIAAGLMLAAALPTAPAQALSLRTFVSGVGSDSNDCSRAAPCRTFAVAITKTAAAGEIYALDAAGYGSVTITKSINIIGAVLGVGITVAPNGVGISVQAGPFDRVRLRGLTIDGNRVGGSGIVVGSVGSLMIEDSVINGFMYYGVVFNPTTNSASKASETGLIMTNTVVSGAFTSNSPTAGIHIQPTGSGQVRVVLHRVNVSNNYTGIEVESFAYSYPNLIVAVTDSVVAGNQTGISGKNTNGNYGVVHIMVTGTLLSHNGSAVQPAGTNQGLVYIRLGHSTFSGNYYPSTPTGTGHILSARDNYSDDAVVYPETFARN